MKGISMNKISKGFSIVYVKVYNGENGIKLIYELKAWFETVTFVQM
jgi:hypothetical protein